MFRRICLSLLLIAPGTFLSAAHSQAQTSAADDANTLFQAQKWTEAAKAYEAITKAEPDNGRAWLRLGVSFHQSGKYEQAITAYQQAVTRLQGQFKTIAMYNLVAAYARLNDKEKAFEWLDKLSSGGLPLAIAGQLQGDEDLTHLRDDPRFKEVLVAADKLLNPCMYSLKSRELDFWVGEWQVMVGGQIVGTNNVQRVEGGCVIMENWAASGQTGRSINFYNPVTNKWRQTYVGSNLGIWEMSGEYKDGAMHYEGEVYTAGSMSMTRMTFFNLGPDNIRQLGENSIDGGKTWIVVWDAKYMRKK